ncbi:multimodular transpeptidase-transglycosylase PbpC [Caulobacter vibrioides]|uniref:Penicillin-binding protein, 1A family n=2 Tax=Caulobacter vibrioides TaxID=155892 RepID=Q9A3C7_CAUVC|nr:multimodular transpeptidase-transglycosylase PbpC [Caulobacter vibrioides]YP_002518759.1 multimodular transpeptidase-transglycosylase PbpC [Caulobacter vibrioides NA1000]AAK25239.1 penicillin-binding protein, 1A family [Caulobacter vibrioides CB15]ACL96851.1 multimodular transpeptidase-transglycosylase PbpC [Caulobacter vibrioides NA1000]ATC30104.1 penicillin-binding protein [Caulobacter vibrioides]QXZ51629.1 multimodular transpeptidase-transglycosylase PbpC [Caulobacter vibrioides]
MNDWTLPPYKFDDGKSPGEPPKPGPASASDGVSQDPWAPQGPDPFRLSSDAATPPPPPEPPPEEPFRADLKHAAAKKKARKWGWVWGTLLVGFLLAVLSVAGGGAYVWFKYLKDTPALPSREALFAVNRAPGIRFEDRNGQVIATRGPRYGQRITLGTVPNYVPMAFLAAEDRRFYQHGAIDVQGIARAAWINWRAGKTRQGASTLTQQLAKGLFLTPDRVVKRKLQEMLLAYKLEQILTKDEILELYLNRIYFGAGTYGIDGASQTYFGKPASQLTLSEAALLASLPKAPSRLALTRDMERALARSRLILANMRKEGWITPEQESRALDDTPRLSPMALQDEGDYGWVLDYATAEAVKIAGQNAPDLVVRLTIDPLLQSEGAEVVRQTMATETTRSGASQAALLSLSADGAIRAMVGGTDYSESPFNRAVQAKRQPGSTFKPFVYAAAVEKGVLPTDMRVDEPVKFGTWEPENYSGGYRGPMTVEDALVTSINTVAVKLGQEVGGPAIGDLVRRFGITSLPPSPDLSVALGSYEVNLLQITSGFQVFQQGGLRIEPYVIESITTQGGQQIFQHQPPQGERRVYDVAHASMMVKMMKKVVTQGTAQRAAFGRPVAGKTGTSQNWRDAWFVGFTPDYVTGVWVGNDDEKPMNKVVGGDIPASIWRRFMMTAHQTLAVRDFEWLLPDPAPQSEPDPRNGFYETLSAEFSRAASELETTTPVAPAPGQPPPDNLPY